MQSVAISLDLQQQQRLLNELRNLAD